MTCEIVFLPVGNADCIAIHSEDALVMVDLGNKSRFIYKWLQQKSFNKINRIYITHKHRDHFPFTSLIKLVEFLELWFKSGGEIEIFSLPYGVYQDAIDKLGAKVGLVTQDTCYECVGQPAIADKIKSNFSQIKSPLPLQAEYL